MQGQTQDEAVRLRPRLREDEKPREGDGEDEEIDEEQIEGKGPRHRVDVAFPGILHDEHVELPGQEHHGHHRDEEHGRPPRVGGGLRLIQGEEAGPHRIAHDLAEDFPGALEETPRDVHADDEEGHELDHGFHRHRGHEAGLLLGEVEVAGSEQDAEQGEGDRHEQGGIEDVEHRAFLDDHAEGRGHRAKLERDVRNHPRHHEHGDQRAEVSRLAVAAGDKVRDGRDALLLGHPHQLAQEERPQKGDARRPQVDGEELEATIGGEAHAAVERPRRAVHGGGEHVGDGADPRAAQSAGEGLAGGGDKEQEDEVPEEDGEQHGLA